MLSRLWAVVIVTAGCAGITAPERGPPDRAIGVRSSARHSTPAARAGLVDPAIDTLIRDSDTGNALGTDQMTAPPSIGYTSTTETTQVMQDGDECVDTQERSAQLAAQDIAVFFPGPSVVFPGSLVALNGIEAGRLDG